MAAGAVIGALRVNLGLSSAKFKSGLKDADGRLTKFKRRMRTGLKAVGVAAALAIGGIVTGMKSFLDSADNMQKLAQSIGIPIEELTALNHAAELSGISLDALSTGVRKLSQNMVQIAQGAKNEASRAFEELGVKVVDASGKIRSSTDVMDDVADSFAKMEDGAEKTGLAMAVFGRAGAAMIPLLNAGSKGIKVMTDEARKLGLVISKDTAQSAERFNDNIVRIKGAIKGFGITIASHLAEPMAKISDFLVQMINGFSGLPEPIQKFISIGGGLAVLLAAIAVPLGAIAIAVGTISLPVIAIGAAIAGLTAILITFWPEIVKANQEILRLANVALQALLDMPGRVVDAFIRMKDAVLQAVQEMVEGIGVWLGEKLDAIVAKIQNIGDRIAAPFKKAWQLVVGQSWIPDLVRDVETWMRRLAQSAPALADQAADGIDDAFAGIGSIGDRIASTFQQIGNSIAGLINGTLTWKEALGNVLQTLAQIFFQSVNFSGFGAVGGLLQGILGGLFGFAKGGSFLVGGAGGADSQFVGFKASPNERVEITTPRQQDMRGGGGGRVVLEVIPSNYFDARVREVSGEVAIETTSAIVAQNDAQRHRARLTGQDGG